MATYFRSFVAIVLMPSVAFGFTVPCPASGIRGHVQLLQKIAVMGEENRLVFAEYAKLKGLPIEDVYKAFSAVGILTCGGAFLTAQLTKSKDMITTAGHAFFNEECGKYKVNEPCTFKMVTPPYEKTTVKMDSVVAACTPHAAQEDWAVAKLEKPMPGTPFEIPPDDRYIMIDDNMQVTQVSAHAFNFKVGKNHPPTVQECRLTESWHFVGVPIQTDCDSGGWSSGSAQLDGEPGSFTMAAMIVGEPKGGVDSLPYDRDKNFNFSIPVAGKFREAILKMADQ